MYHCDILRALESVFLIYVKTQGILDIFHKKQHNMATQITKNFTLEEFYATSATAKARKIDNTPNAEQIKNIEALVKNVLQPIRDKYGKPIIVTCGYRCPKLNSAVGGVKTSQHLTAEAADIRTKSDTVKDNKELFDLIVGMINSKQIQVGQLIDEYNYNWIHISSPRKNGKPNNQVLHIK